MKTIFFFVTTLFLLSSCAKEEADFEIHMLEFKYYDDTSLVATIFAPNAFSPDGDGKNDVFKLVSQGIRQEGFALKIYNKDNQLLFETNELNGYWDGRYHGESVVNDVYLYSIDAVAVNGTTLHFNNELVLLK